MQQTILIVEDEKGLAEIIKLSLENAGYNVMTADDGKAGLDIALAHTIDLIVSDVMMPVMDGFAFYKEIRAYEKTANIPIIILTARDKMQDTFEVVGAEGFIPKPFEEDKLLAMIERLIQLKNKKDEAQLNRIRLESLLEDEDDKDK
jgi:two-component system alkaline phosphatase synthesis response regulator PhoP